MTYRKQAILAAALAVSLFSAAPVRAQGKAAPAVPPAPSPALSPSLAPAPALSPERAAALAKLYSDCMALARSAPAQAIRRAEAWERDGGGDGARHCAAVAYLSSGRYEEAASRLERLAATAEKATLRAELHAQAGQAWMIAGKPEKALAAQTRALQAGGPRLEYLIDRAITQASLGHYFDAIDDLGAVLDAEPDRTEALVMRATAWRKLRHFDLAADDVRRALTLAPDNADALLERGILRLLRGDRVGAVADWRTVADTAPGSIAAEAARENLRRDAEAAAGGAR